MMAYFIKKKGLNDKRNQIVNECIKGAKSMKFNAWEDMMRVKLKEIRSKETVFIAKVFANRGMSAICTGVVPAICSIICFSVYVKYVGDLSVADAYSVLLLFNLVEIPLNLFKFTLSNFVRSASSMDRVVNFLKIKEHRDPADHADFAKGEIIIKKASYTWDDPFYRKLFKNTKGNARMASFMGKKVVDTAGDKADQVILSDINVHVEAKSFTAIVGKVGGGKSSLLMGMMNEIGMKAGSFKKNGNYSFISQEAFLLNDTLEKNILFGLEMDRSRYEKVIEICQLKPDIEMLSGGDQTEIGENGINLSGGQKQRVSIARAVYADRDIYLIDDCLSALDAYVGKKILDEVFLDFLKEKTRVMVTHHLHFLDELDHVIVVEKGKISVQGSFEEIKDSQEYKTFSTTLKEEEEKEQKEQEEAEKEDSLNKDEKKPDIFVNGAPHKDEDNKETFKKKADSEVQSMDFALQPGEVGFLDMESTIKKNESNQVEKEKIEKSESGKDQLSLRPKPDQISLTPKDEKKSKNQEELKEKGKLTTKETRFVGMVGRDVYYYYFSKGGFGLMIFCLIMFFLSVMIKLSGSWWIGQWANDSFGLSLAGYLGIYAGINVLYVLAYLVQFILYGKYCSEIGLKIFIDVIWNILRRSMMFFDTTKVGVLLNICSKDVASVDIGIPFMLTFFLESLFGLLGTIVLSAIVTPITVFIIIFNLIIFSFYISKYIRTAM